MTAEEFKQKIKDNACPFCGKTLTHYEGIMGYEAMRCFDCGLSSDYAGIHVEEIKEEKEVLEA